MSNKLGNDRDCLTRFVLGRSGVRGALVRLNDAWQGIRQRTDYPTAVESCLGETCAAAALFTSHIKMEGRLSVQLRGTGVLRTLFAECTTAGTLRGIAHHGELLPGRLTPRAFGSDAILAISIETLAPGAREMQRYQGMVGLDADELSEAFESYFAQSEQLPTRIRLFGGKDVAAALMLQQLPEGHGDRDGWARANALFETLTDAELAELPVETLLWRLFHDEQLQLLGHKPLSFACSCSRERVSDMLRSLGHAEASAAAETGTALIHCDFCGQAYTFSQVQIDGLFVHGPEVPGPESLQ